jgi:hypothetical protein
MEAAGMNAEDVRVAAQIECGMKIEAVTGFIWIKSAINEIVGMYPNAGEPVSEDFEISDSAPTYKPKRELAQIKRVVRGKTRTALSPNTEFVFEDGTVRPLRSGAYTIEYYAFPDLGESSFSRNRQIPLPRPFQEQIKFRLAANMRGRAVGRTDPNTIAFEQKFSDGILRASLSLGRQNARHRRMPPRR